MVEEARLVPIHARVYHGPVVQREEECMVALHRVVIVAAIGLGVRDSLAHVLYQARALPDAAGGERTTSLDG
jgi:hypothetical protein